MFTVDAPVQNWSEVCPDAQEYPGASQQEPSQSQDMELEVMLPHEVMQDLNLLRDIGERNLDVSEEMQILQAIVVDNLGD